jgi:diguanylate cyclase (GGDEF)-like protein
MQDGAIGPDAADRVLPDRQNVRGQLVARLALGMAVFLAINMAVGLFAYDRQSQMGDLAIGIYDRAVIGMTYVPIARSAFVKLAASAPRIAAEGASGATYAALDEVLADINLAIERAGSPEARALGEKVRADLIAFGNMSTPEGMTAIEAKVDQDFAALAQRTATDGLRARDRIGLFAQQSDLLLLISVGISAVFVLLTGALLGRAVLQRQSSVARIAHMSRYDGLTELLNRTSFHDAIRQAADRAARGHEFAVLCIDLDRFKQVNDTLGHPVGDALLRAVAARLRSLLRETDAVARLGGDEFAVLQVPITSSDSAALLAQRMVDTLREPYDVAGHRVVIGATVGIAFGHEGAREVDTLLRNADLALYRAKQEGRGIFRFFEPEMDARAQARRQLELDLRGAIEREEFEIFYQPLISVVDLRVAVFEALIRWRHPLRGLVSPDEFVPLAEEIGLIVEIGGWVLRRACREAAGWPEPVGVAVNLSATQFARADVAQQVGAALRESGLRPGRLEVEITETALLNDSQRTLDTLHALRNLGVRIAMDDFGTGYSSLSYLRSFPFDKLKIDRSFIRDLGETGESAAIVKAIAGMGKSLGIETTAEGVETEAQMRQLVEDGCTELQGFFFSEPCQASEVGRVIATHGPDRAQYSAKTASP